MMRPINGLNVCAKHGGGAKHARTAAARRVAEIELRAEAAQDLTRLGVRLEVTPIEALEAMLWEAAGTVAVLRQMVAELPLAAQQFADPERGVESRDGIYGRTYHQSGVPTGEAKPHVLVGMYNDERDRLANIAAVCAKLGLDDRRVRLAEVQTERLLAGVTRAIAEVGLDAAQVQIFKRALAQELRS